MAPDKRSWRINSLIILCFYLSLGFSASSHFNEQDLAKISPIAISINILIFHAFHLRLASDVYSAASELLGKECNLHFSRIQKYGRLFQRSCRFQLLDCLKRGDAIFVGREAHESNEVGHDRSGM